MFCMSDVCLSLMSLMCLTFVYSVSQSHDLYNLTEKPAIVIKGLTDQKVTAGDTVKLEMEASKSDAPGQWFKDDSPIEKSDRIEIAVNDKKHSLTIKDTVPEDAGEYTVEVGEDASTATVKVDGRLLWQQAMHHYRKSRITH